MRYLFLVCFPVFFLSCLSQNTSKLAAWRNTPAEDSLITYVYKRGKNNHSILGLHKNGTYKFHSYSGKWMWDDKGSWTLTGDTLLITSSLNQQHEKLTARRKKIISTSNKKTYKARKRIPKY
jgi:hypothetical protein